MLSASASLLTFMTAGFSCQRNNSKEVEDAVYYFPAKNVYYDTRQYKYYYSMNGGKSWDSMDYNGAGIGTALGPKVSVERTTENIWMNNEQDRKTYNGVLLNTVNNKTTLIAKTDSMSKIKPVKPVGKKSMVDQADNNEPPPKKGLKKLFNNLFGKKKKPVDEKKQ